MKRTTALAATLAFVVTLAAAPTAFGQTGAQTGDQTAPLRALPGRNANPAAPPTANRPMTSPQATNPQATNPDVAQLPGNARRQGQGVRRCDDRSTLSGCLPGATPDNGNRRPGQPGTMPRTGP